MKALTIYNVFLTPHTTHRSGTWVLGLITPAPGSKSLANQESSSHGHRCSRCCVSLRCPCSRVLLGDEAEEVPPQQLIQQPLHVCRHRAAAGSTQTPRKSTAAPIVGWQLHGCCVNPAAGTCRHVGCCYWLTHITYSVVVITASGIRRLAILPLDHSWVAAETGRTALSSCRVA